MTQAEKETIEAFCRELALALRRITGRDIEFPLAILSDETQDTSAISGQNDKTDNEQDKKS